MKNIKIHSWKAEEALPIPEKGEENACVVSFRLANVKGLKYFLTAFKLLSSAGEIVNFNGCSLLASAGGFFATIYGLLKDCKNKTEE